MSLENLQIAALLHDIGKFYQRTGKNHVTKYKSLSTDDYGYSGAHGKWSASYTTKMELGSQIEELVLYHHHPDKSGYVEMAKILQKADHHSSKERLKTGEKKEVIKEPLISVFSKVNLGGIKKPVEYYIPLKNLDQSSVDYIPKPTKEEAMSGWNLQDSYKQLWNAFESESSKIENKDDFNTIYYLLKKYTSFIPSAVYVDEPDISLFDHSKTTAALVTCLYFYKQDNGKLPNDDEESYLVLSGDISGIQNFIYKISSPQEAQKGMSKRLRGRSFYLTLLNDAIAHRIIHELKLTEANILFCGGGHFTIIAPHTKKTHEVLEKISSEINQELLERYNSELFLALAVKPCSGSDLENFGDLLEETAFENQRMKRQKFKGMLDGVFQEEDVLPANLCPVCAKEKSESSSFCSSCEVHEELGRKIANANYIMRIITDEIIGTEFYEFGVEYRLVSKDKDVNKILDQYISKSQKIDLLKLNDSQFTDLTSDSNNKKVSYGFSFIGNTVPSHSREGTFYFNHLAEISKGANKLGVLKMDVDNLGNIFAEGLENPTISRISTMSSFMDLFFSGMINRIASKYRVLEVVCDDCRPNVEEIKIFFGEDDHETVMFREKEGKEVCDKCATQATPTIYITYSGGDDLLVVGPYDDIIRFSNDLREEFKKWTCENSDITLSAGIFMGGSKFPIERGVKNADKYLELSKDFNGKDAVTVFSETVKWDTYERFKGFKDLFGFGLKLEKLCDEGKISKGLVYSMLVMWDNTFLKPTQKRVGGSQDRIRLERRNYVPMFKYKLRIVKDRKLRVELNSEGLKFMPWIKIPASWVSLRTR